MCPSRVSQKLLQGKSTVGTGFGLCFADPLLLSEPEGPLVSLQAAVTRAVLTSGGLPMLVGCAQLMDCPEASIISGRCLQLMVEQQPELRNQVVDIAEQQGDTSLKTLFPGEPQIVQAYLHCHELLRGLPEAAALQQGRPLLECPVPRWFMMGGAPLH